MRNGHIRNKKLVSGIRREKLDLSHRKEINTTNGLNNVRSHIAKKKQKQINA